MKLISKMKTLRFNKKLCIITCQHDNNKHITAQVPQVLDEFKHNIIITIISLKRIFQTTYLLHSLKLSCYALNCIYSMCSVYTMMK